MTDTAAARVTEFATSEDGTRIAFERSGSGPLLVLVDGALCTRAFGPAREVAAELADRFTVVAYDRRGRGESGDTQPYAPERELDDLHAVITAAGGDAFVMGQSSGAALAYLAAAAGVPMRKVMGYEAPWIGARTGRDGRPMDYRHDLVDLLARGRNGKAVGYFLVTMVGAPFFVPTMMKLMPKVWGPMRQTATSLPYDAAVMGAAFTPPTEVLATITVPALVLCGGKSPATMSAAQDAVAAAIPGSRRETLPGQTHQVSPKALAPAIAAFFSE